MDRSTDSTNRENDEQMNRIAEYEELIDAIKNGVCEEYGCDLGSMSAKSGRKKAYVEPRHIAIHLCRKHLDASYKDLAEKFGMSDHTSAMHAHNTISWLSERDKRISRIIVKIESSLLHQLSCHKKVVYYTCFDGKTCHGIYKDKESVVLQPTGTVVPIVVCDDGKTTTK